MSTENQQNQAVTTVAVEMKRLSDFTFSEMVEIWNRGFEGYMVDISMSMQRLVGRFELESLSPELSVVACVNGEPAGFVMNAIRQIGGKKVAWNGGTGVAVPFRRLGIGKQLISACLDLYREHGVEVATLEAIRGNEKAIALYEQYGYQTVDIIAFYQHTGETESRLFTRRQEGPYRAIYGMPADAAVLPFYNTSVAWQTQWQSVRDGGAIILQSETNVPVGYALYKRTFNDHAQFTGVVLYQCEVNPEISNKSEVVSELLSRVFDGPNQEYGQIRRSTVNVSTRNELVIDALTGAGFTQVVDQVQMTRDLD